MRVKEINVQFSFTKNLGNYESARTEAGAVIELEKEEDYTRAFKNAFDIVKKEVKNQISKVKYQK